MVVNLEQQGTSMRTTVMLLIVDLRKIRASLSR
jgi:hypothetical protein